MAEEEWSCSSCLTGIPFTKESLSPIKSPLKRKNTGQQNPQKRQKLEKLRRMAKKSFEETFSFIFSGFLNEDMIDPTIDLNNPQDFADRLEEELFLAYNTDGEPNEAYKVKYRSLQVRPRFNISLT